MQTDSIGELDRRAMSLNLAAHPLFRSVAKKDATSVLQSMAKIAVRPQGAVADA